MQPIPATIYALIKGCKTVEISEHKLRTLETVGEYLDDNCDTKEFQQIADAIKSTVRTVYNYVAIYRNAYKFGMDEGDRDALILKAREGHPHFQGVLCLMDQKVVGKSRFISVVSRFNEPVKLPRISKTTAKSATSEELEVVIRSLRKKLQQVEEFNTDLHARFTQTVNEMKRLQALEKALTSSFPTTDIDPLAKTIKFLTSLSDNLSDKGLELLSLAMDLTDLAQVPKALDFPDYAVWQGQYWVNIVLEQDFEQPYRKFSEKDKSKVLEALKFLVVDWRFKSLQSKKLEITAIPGALNAIQSRASIRIRFYWSVEAPKDLSKWGSLRLHKLVVKKG